jgi:hypothetical protein
LASHQLLATRFSEQLRRSPRHFFTRYQQLATQKMLQNAELNLHPRKYVKN